MYLSVVTGCKTVWFILVKWTEVKERKERGKKERSEGENEGGRE